MVIEMGKILVIEGLDGSGKGTQSELLRERLSKENIPFYLLDFPQYSEESSYFVRSYLSGLYGINAEDVSAYQASLCYAMDRFHAFKSNKELKEAYDDPNVLLLANRYTTSNMLFQATKLETDKMVIEFINWLENIEYDLLEIPKPSLVLMPYISFEENIKLLKKRDIEKNAHKNGMATDIHESNINYLKLVHERSFLVASYCHFRLVNGMNNEGKLRKIDDIHEEMYGETLKLIRKK